MPIQLTPIINETLVQGYTWQVSNDQLLAEFIAGVALGQAHHVRKIMLSVGDSLPLPVAGVRADAMKMLTVAAGDEPWHRDGWMFQVMSWLSALKASPNSLINAPQMIRAQKGFDGLQLDFDASGNISAVVIFEDKATDNPRATVRNEVWPEFEQFENDGYLNVLVSEVTGLLEKRPGIDVDAVIRKVIWKDARHYRVSITVGDTHATGPGRGRLFKGYDETVKGDIKRRRGETFHVKDLRKWMDSVAEKAKSHISSLKATHV